MSEYDISKILANEPIYAGKAKSIYKIEENEKEVLVEFRDDITAGNGAKHDVKSGKGYLNTLISTELFNVLEKNNVPTHLIEYIEPNIMIAKNVKIIPLEVIVRNIAAGSLCKKYPFEQGQVLKTAVTQYDYKNDDYGDPMLNNEIAIELGLATEEELVEIKKLALKVNDVLKGFFDEKGIILVDFKIEVGKTADGQIVVADEISPDTMRLWDKETKDVLDKDVFRKDLGDVLEKYKIVAERIGCLK
ncbi:phosphoribosylaminoimidazolesuccinocarboxamide synthase [Methanococcus maripaludis]|jgi:phosphoribosylaminoimidazole-succinocarboxamide synthase|uniref:Phosphoribosylaminoimidazole-succinocarboxamide synthase n=3 Tax=Methanococcus maripaludis TaxID=39152 RepID=A0A7J9S062_METMI|nr:phosphoribosylaminoimidazolesuccinocarboxamide synthase [Methanococcus maripaludis]MDK2929327.1 phosphoribosylaminoimidazole-succinocarboxamide synthase [Methanococcus sp.]MBA2851090.1 phosphoribosylaminoimidazole-succinocarboxamide synthase [Methanococcus maripaludis]MBB6067633.1 phosphoribosylaminoimidazole-succinocarboxamide synthase [Methanococcus maripaludis]MBG0769763.1 phosphoribosylaminoimidazolesuccinocarboxamide synthase [Methanococcus maripaludis]MBM7408521.1 phosphoribosylaminoi